MIIITQCQNDCLKSVAETGLKVLCGLGSLILRRASYKQINPSQR